MEKKLLREENTELHRQIDEWVEKVSGVNGLLMDLFYDGVVMTTSHWTPHAARSGS